MTQVQPSQRARLQSDRTVLCQIRGQLRALKARLLETLDQAVTTAIVAVTAHNAAAQKGK
jgi:hypothetical protein